MSGVIQIHRGWLDWTLVLVPTLTAIGFFAGWWGWDVWTTTLVFSFLVEAAVWLGKRAVEEAV